MLEKIVAVKIVLVSAGYYMLFQTVVVVVAVVTAVYNTFELKFGDANCKHLYLL